MCLRAYWEQAVDCRLARPQPVARCRMAMALAAPIFRRSRPRTAPPTEANISPLQNSSLLFSLTIELREIGPEVLGFFLVLDPGEDHLSAWNLGPRILDVVQKG